VFFFQVSFQTSVSYNEGRRFLFYCLRCSGYCQCYQSACTPSKGRGYPYAVYRAKFQGPLYFIWSSVRDLLRTSLRPLCLTFLMVLCLQSLPPPFDVHLFSAKVLEGFACTFFAEDSCKSTCTACVDGNGFADMSFVSLHK
jgi:hypothetical protein